MQSVPKNYPAFCLATKLKRVTNVFECNKLNPFVGFVSELLTRHKIKSFLRDRKKISIILLQRNKSTKQIREELFLAEVHSQTPSFLKYKLQFGKLCYKVELFSRYTSSINEEHENYLKSSKAKVVKNKD